MADLMTVSGSSGTSNGVGIASSRRPIVGPALTSSPSGIRGPRMIMRERAAREARQKAEAEKLVMERDRAEQEARLVEEAQRISTEQSTGVAVGQGAAADAHRFIDNQDPGKPVPEPAQTSRAPESIGATKLSSPQPQPQPQPQDAQRAKSQAYAAPDKDRHQASRQRPNSDDQITSNLAAQQQLGISKPRNSFPHAFERWETLSAHWEGLTSYWIRKLEQNKDEIQRDALSHQLARQVTDLSAAGANLFHAVVELQRLRASSKRKFQRWFFETRTELERAHEVNAMMDAALQKERRDRADAIRDAIEQERGSTKIQKQLAEMRKELAISKEEARRAWKELGRREQKERDRTLSLQAGLPTLVGGVQVVPMRQGATGRNGAARDSGKGLEYQQVLDYQTEPVESSPSRTPSPTAARGTDSTPLGQQHPKGPDASSQATGGREGGYGDDDYQTPATANPPGSSHAPPASPAGETRWTGAYSDPQDYTGQGYGAPEWEAMPRHHHPTRLSDVIEEEDERSRMSRV